MKKLELTTDEAVEYLKENLKVHDVLEIAYNRIFAEGEVLNVDFSEYYGKPGFKILLNLEGETLNPTVEIDFNEIKDDLIEFHLFPQNGEDVYVSII